MITLYSQPGCPQCRMVHMLLDRKKIEYNEVQDVELMTQKGIRHTPAIEVEGKILQGKEMMDYINTKA